MTASPQTPRRRGAPPRDARLTRDDVVAGATDLIAAGGLDAFSMRRLATSLGVRPNALYNHVEDRDGLLSLVVDRFVAGFVLPDETEPWPVWLAEVARVLRRHLRGQPSLTRVALARAGGTTAGTELLGGVHRRLESAGLDPALAHTAWHAVLTLVVGVVQQEQVRDRDDDPMFEALLDLTVRALVGEAAGPVREAARRLLVAHADGVP